jgi:hypothetical protein
MADSQEVFNAQIKATDDTSKVVDSIKEHLKELGKEAEHVGHQTEGIHHPHMWFALGEHVDVTKEKFHGMHLAVGEVGHSITELLPAVAALGAAGSVAALFETVEHVSEAYATLAHEAVSLGMSANALNNLRAVAKLTDTDVDMMEKSVSRLNRTLGDTVAGKNKDVAALFAHLHLNPRGFRDGADALPALADAFEHTSSATMRARMAFALFGRSGTDMIPMLVQGGEKLRELQKDAGRLNINFAPYAEGLEKYNEDQKKLNLAVGGFTDLLGGKLAPILGPLTEQATDFILANREWITGEIADGVREFSVWLKQVPWDKIGGDIKTAGHYAHEFIDDIGGSRVAIEVLVGAMALKGVMFLAGPIKETAEFALAVGNLAAKLTTELVGAWGKVGTAAEAAGAEEIAALRVGREASVAGGAAAVEGEVAGASRAAMAVVGLAKAIPIIGTGVIVASEVAPLMHDAALNYTVPGELEQRQRVANFRNAGRGLEAGGQHDYGTYEGPTGRNVRQMPRDDSHWMSDVRQTVDKATDYLPRPVWSEHPGYGGISSPMDARSPSDERLRLANQPFDLSPGFGNLPNGKVDVVVHLPNMPPGATVETTSSGNVGDVRTNLGNAWMDLYP